VELPIPTERRHLACVLAVATLSQSRPSAAQPAARSASLVVTRADGAQDCPDAAALVDQVRTIAGADVVAAGLGGAASRTLIQVAIEHNFSGYSAQISAAGARHGSRTLQDWGPTCSSLADAVAVTIAIFLDPYANPLPKAPASIAATAASPPASTVVKAHEPTPPSSFFAEASGGGALNVLAHSVPFVAGQLGWRPSPRWAVALGGAILTTDSTAPNGGRVELRLAYASLQACGTALGDVRGPNLAWCVAQQVGSLGGAGDRYRTSSSEHAWWLAMALGPQATFPLTPALAWVLTGNAVIPWVRQGFDTQTNGLRTTAFRSPALGGLVSLGIRGNW